VTTRLEGGDPLRLLEVVILSEYFLLLIGLFPLAGFVIAKTAIGLGNLSNNMTNTTLGAPFVSPGAAACAGAACGAMFLLWFVLAYLFGSYTLNQVMQAIQKPRYVIYGRIRLEEEIEDP